MCVQQARQYLEGNLPLVLPVSAEMEAAETRGEPQGPYDAGMAYGDHDQDLNFLFEKLKDARLVSKHVSE